ncbi:MAG: DUF1905 domain-containing protein [Saprospiraceae bacterium]|jgi:hypothetical protein|nr:DUF1905 domain-containing protein [Saprospiraceae bacterium]
MLAGIKYNFSAKIWKYESDGGWHFISLPEEIAKEIRENLGWQEEAWGRLKVNAKIGNSSWETSIWFDKKLNTYLLPLKVKIRKEANIEVGQVIKVVLNI